MGIYAFTKDPLHQDRTVLLHELRLFFFLSSLTLTASGTRHGPQSVVRKDAVLQLYHYTIPFDLFHSKQNADRLSSGHQP